MENGEGYITIPTHRIESATWQLHTLLSRPIATATCFEAPEHPCQKLQTFGYSWQNLNGCCTESRSPTPTCLCICSLACYLEIQNRRWLKSKGRKKKAKRKQKRKKPRANDAIRPRIQTHNQSTAALSDPPGASGRLKNWSNHALCLTLVQSSKVPTLTGVDRLSHAFRLDFCFLFFSELLDLSHATIDWACSHKVVAFSPTTSASVNKTPAFSPKPLEVSPSNGAQGGRVAGWQDAIPSERQFRSYKHT